MGPAPQRRFHSFVSMLWHSSDIPLSKSGMGHIQTGAVPVQRDASRAVVQTLEMIIRFVPGAIMPFRAAHAPGGTVAALCRSAASNTLFSVAVCT